MDHKLTLLLFTIFLAVTRSSQALSGCDERGERLISRNRTLAPLSLIQASHDITSLTSFSGAKENIYNFGDHGDTIEAWCTLSSLNPVHYIVMGFTSPVLITAMVSSGYIDEAFSSVSLYYVSNFTLEYAPSLDDSANFTYYHDYNNSPKYFEVPETNTLIRFERPLIAQQLRLTAVDWVDTDETTNQYVCQGVALYGCPYTQDSNSTTGDAGESTTTISTQTPTTNNSPMTDDSPTALQQVVVRDYQALGIALPIAFITVIICGALVAVGVYMCYVISKRQKQGETRRYENLDSSVKTLERTPSEMEHAYANADSRKKSITKILNNPIYGVGTGGPDSQLELVTHTEEEHIYTSASETGYEPIDLNAEKREMETEGDDMIDNSAYGEVEIHPQHDTQDDDTTAVDLKQNACYDGSTPATPLPDEGEYAYAIVESGQQKHGH